jgi:hypothetical protein
MKRWIAPVVAALAVLIFTGTANAAGLATDREAWFKLNDRSDVLLALWSQGVSDALTIVVRSRGCEHIPVSGAALASATTDYLRERTQLAPLSGAILVYERLSGCSVLTNGRPLR